MKNDQLHYCAHTHTLTQPVYSWTDCWPCCGVAGDFPQCRKIPTTLDDQSLPVLTVQAYNQWLIILLPPVFKNFCLCQNGLNKHYTELKKPFNNGTHSSKQYYLECSYICCLYSRRTIMFQHLVSEACQCSSITSALCLLFITSSVIAMMQALTHTHTHRGSSYENRMFWLCVCLIQVLMKCLWGHAHSKTPSQRTNLFFSLFSP